jgi:hypothetical protein
MEIHRDAFALVQSLARSGSWMPLERLDDDPDLPADAIAFVPGLVELGFVQHSDNRKSVRISIQGIALVRRFKPGWDW